MAEWHLMRTWYATDHDPAEPDYPGNRSATIPVRAFIEPARIVNVDWSTPGEVEVTFLVPGPGHDPRLGDNRMSPDAARWISREARGG